MSYLNWIRNMSQLDKEYFAKQMRRLHYAFPKAKKWEIKELRKAYYNALKYTEEEHLEHAISIILSQSADKKPWYWPTVSDLRVLMPTARQQEIKSPQPPIRLAHKHTCGYNPTESDRKYVDNLLREMGFKK